MEELTTTERNDLQYHEQIIEKGLATFIEVGESLWTIREHKLYKEQYTRFEDYCKERWGFSKTHANRLIGAKVLQDEMTPTGAKITSERQARELAKVPKEKREETIQSTIERDGKLTARGIGETFPAPEHVVTEETKRAVEDAKKESETLWLLKQYWMRATKLERKQFLNYIKKESI